MATTAPPKEAGLASAPEGPATSPPMRPMSSVSTTDDYQLLESIASERDGWSCGVNRELCLSIVVLGA